MSAPWSPWVAIRPPLVAATLGFIAFAFAYLVAYRFGQSFSPAVSAPFWFPDSVLLCALLSTPRRRWWLLLLGILPLRLLGDPQAGAPWWFLGSVYLNDCAKGVIGAWLLQKFMRDPIRLSQMRELGVYCLIAVVLLPAASALLGAASRASLGASYWASFEQWLLGDAMANLVLTPILFYWVLRPPNPATFSTPRLIEAGLLAIGLLLTMAWAFEPIAIPSDMVETRFYAPVPFMVWAAFRFRMPGATAAVAVLTVFAVGAAIDGTGSFAALTHAEVSSRLQHFLLLRAAPLFLVAVLVEEWVSASSSLLESEQRFRLMADQSPMKIWLASPEGRCEFVNRRWLEFTGLTREEFMGDGWNRIVHPDDFGRSNGDYLRSIEARESFENEARLRRHDGEYRWILSHGAPRFSPDGKFLGYVGSAIDMTERRQQEAALKRSEARYRDVVESQSSFVCRMLPDGTLTFVNSAYCRFLRRERSELLGQNFLDLVSPAAREAARRALAQALDGPGHVTWECEVANPDGTRGWQSWVCHTLDGVPDEARELQLIGADVTDRKRAEESGRQLAHATRFAAVGELTAMVAHEINQPLCAILSNAEAAEILLRSDDPPLEELRNILADIRKDDLRADSAIRSIRSLLQRREFEPRRVDLAGTIDHVFKLTAGDALHRRVPMRRDVPADLPPVIGDRSYLEQVLVILMVNGMDSMKGTPEDARELVVTARLDGAMVEVSVTDRGHGIAPEHMPQLFDSFFTTKSDGMGMGLSIARSMIAAHGGRIWAENSASGGATFRFTLRVDYAASRH